MGLKFMSHLYDWVPDIVDVVSLIPYRGIFEHRTLNPAIILFHSFTEQIL